MSKLKSVAALACGCVLAAGAFAGCAQKNPEPSVALPAGYVAVRPEKISGNLHNPGMGWITLEETSWQGKSDLGLSGELEEVDVVGIQDTWALIEETPNEFDFSRIDEAMTHLI